MKVTISTDFNTQRMEQQYLELKMKTSIRNSTNRCKVSLNWIAINLCSTLDRLILLLLRLTMTNNQHHLWDNNMRIIIIISIMIMKEGNITTKWIWQWREYQRIIFSINSYLLHLLPQRIFNYKNLPRISLMITIAFHNQKLKEERQFVN